MSALLGDFYASPEQLDVADPTELTELLAIIQSQRKSDGGVESKDVELEKATAWRSQPVLNKAGEEVGKGGEYVRGGSQTAKVDGAEQRVTDSFFELASSNHEHFAGQHSAKWGKLHQKALRLARQSYAAAQRDDKAGAEELKRQAIMLQANGAHFLQDSFCSGHAIEHEPVSTWMRERWLNNPDFKEKAILKLKEAAYADIWYGPNATIDKTLDPLIRSIPIDAVANAGVKVLHDYLNEHGLQMTNPRQDQWLAKGDYNLHTSPATQAKAKEAMTLAKEQLLATLSGQKPQGNVLDIVPSHAILAGDSTPVPLGREVSVALLPVLETRLLASHDLYGLLQKAKEVSDQVMGPAKEKKVGDVVESQKSERQKKHGSAAEELISNKTNRLGNLDEAGLAGALLNKPDDFVQSVLDTLSASDRDDVAYEILAATSKTEDEAQLKKMGLPLLLRLQAELLTGSVGDDEREQAYRIGTLLERVSDPTDEQKQRGVNNKHRHGDFDSMDAMVAIATATGDPEDGVEEVDALMPTRVMDRTQSRANYLINHYTSMGNLDEAKLAKWLANERTPVVVEIIDQLQDSDDDDDVSYEFMKLIAKSPNEAALKAIDPSVLRRVRRALRSGSSGDDEEAQAKRIDTVLGAL